MRIAYLILAHDQPAHLQRLVARLAAPGAAFFVHIDAKSDLAAFAALAPVVTFCKRRVNGAWGDISLVKATLELMRCAAAEPGGFNRYVLLSGACYPLYTPADIEVFFERHRGTEFIEAFALPDTRYGKTIERIARVSIRKSKPLGRFRWPLQHFLNRVLPLRDYRTVLKGELVTGSQWWCLSGDAVRYVLDVTAREPQVYRFCKFVDCPDEFYFQYILWNSPFRSGISHSLTFTRWTPGKTGPDMLDAHYLPQFAGPVIHASEFKNSPGERREVLFARKFSAASAPVLDAIDAMAAGRQLPMRDEEESALTKVKNGPN